jgi:hypothetical protein
MQPIDFGKDQFQTVSQILRADPQQVPSIFLTEPTSVQDTSDIPREIFFSRHHHDIETEKLWQKVWQAACLEEDIPNVGDRLVHDLADLSVIIVRTAPGEIQVFSMPLPWLALELGWQSCSHTLSLGLSPSVRGSFSFAGTKGIPLARYCLR